MVTIEVIHELLNKNYSSKAIDIVLNASKNADWEGNIHMSASEFAEVCDSKTRYITKALSKMIGRSTVNEHSNSIINERRSLFKRFKKADGTYRYQFSFGTTKLLPHGSKPNYMKSFNLLFEDAFINAPVLAKRLILTACLDFSITKFLKPTFLIDELKKRYFCFKYLTIKQLEGAIEYISSSPLSKYFTTSLLSVKRQDKKDGVVFAFNEFVAEDYTANFTILKVIREAAIEAGYYFELPEAACLSISKQISSVYNKFKLGHKNSLVMNLPFDDVMQLAEKVYKDGLLGMFKSLKKDYTLAQNILGLDLSDEQLEEKYPNDFEEILNGNKASAYFSGVIDNVINDLSQETALNLVRIDALTDSFRNSFRNSVNYYEHPSSVQTELDSTCEETMKELRDKSDHEANVLSLLSTIVNHSNQDYAAKTYEEYKKVVPAMVDTSKIRDVHNVYREKLIKVRDKVVKMKESSIVALRKFLGSAANSPIIINGQKSTLFESTKDMLEMIFFDSNYSYDKYVADLAVVHTDYFV